MQKEIQTNDIVMRAKGIDPMLRIGKTCTSPGMLNEIALQLKKKRLVKLKFLRGALMNKAKDEMTKEILEFTHSILVLDVGNVIAIYK